MNKKVSIIIPVYNTYKELERCISSICNQTYENLEIICVDDGSVDGSEKIVDEFAAKDSRVKVVHQKNSGESHARNVGLKMATGDYIAFCDCDDWLDEDMYYVLVDALEKDDLDMSAVSWYKEAVDENGVMKTTIITNELPIIEGIIDNKLLLEYLYKRDSYRGLAYMWDKLYKRETLCYENGELILFDETHILGGDILYLAEVALNINKARYIDKPFYHYYQRSQSGSHSKDVKKIIGASIAYEKVIDIFREKNVDEMVIGYLKRFMVYHSSNSAEIAYAQKDTEYLKIFQDYMKKYEKEYVELNKQHPERLDRYYEILSYSV